MKRHVVLFAVCGVLGFLGVGCGPSDETAPQTGEESPVESPSGASDDSSEGEVHALARNCQTTCSGTTASGAACGVIGFGSTTFLGGCTKACRFAREDADSKAVASGCVLTSCNDDCR